MGTRQAAKIELSRRTSVPFAEKESIKILIKKTENQKNGGFRDLILIPAENIRNFHE